MSANKKDEEKSVDEKKICMKGIMSLDEENRYR